MKKCDEPPRLSVRLPSDLGSWIAQEASDSDCAMNSVVVEALYMLKSARVEERRGSKHDAAVSKAMKLMDLPRGASIIINSDLQVFRTELLLQRVTSNDLTLSAEIVDEDIRVFKNASI